MRNLKALSLLVLSLSSVSFGQEIHVSASSTAPDPVCDRVLAHLRQIESDRMFLSSVVSAGGALVAEYGATRMVQGSIRLMKAESTHAQQVRIAYSASHIGDRAAAEGALAVNELSEIAARAELRLGARMVKGGLLGTGIGVAAMILAGTSAGEPDENPETYRRNPMALLGLPHGMACSMIKRDRRVAGRALRVSLVNSPVALPDAAAIFSGPHREEGGHGEPAAYEAIGFRSGAGR
jgi:hypothetical protein